jgi:hypothetical protein
VAGAKVTGHHQISVIRQTYRQIRLDRAGARPALQMTCGRCSTRWHARAGQQGGQIITQNFDTDAIVALTGTRIRRLPIAAPRPR